MDNGRPTEPFRCAIVVPTFNRPTRLAYCLDHLARQLGGPYPTIVVDDGGDHSLAATCDHHNDWVTIVRQDNAGPASARNAGARAAVGADLLVFTDDDCQPRRDWVQRLVSAQGGVAGRLVGGRVENALPGNVFSSASQTLCHFLYDWYQSTDSPLNFFTTNNLCCRREEFLALGGFDTSFTKAAAEDRDFGLRWTDAGGELRYAADAVVDHAHHLSLRSFWRQHRTYGLGARQLHRVMDRRGDARPKLEAARFYAGMLTHPITRRERRALTQAALIGLSQVAMVAGYAAALRDERT